MDSELASTFLQRNLQTWLHSQIYPSTTWMSCIPSKDITAIADFLTPWTKSLWSWGRMPFTEYPYLLILFHLSHPISLIQTNIAGLYMGTSTMNLALRSPQCCKLMCSIFWGLHPMIFKALYIVGELTSTSKISKSFALNLFEVWGKCQDF